MKCCDVCKWKGFYIEEASGEYTACLCVLLDKSPFSGEEDDEDDNGNISGSLVLA